MHIRELILIANTPIAVARDFFLLVIVIIGRKRLDMVLTLLILVSKTQALALSSGIGRLGLKLQVVCLIVRYCRLCGYIYISILQRLLIQLLLVKGRTQYVWQRVFLFNNTCAISGGVGLILLDPFRRVAWFVVT